MCSLLIGVLTNCVSGSFCYIIYVYKNFSCFEQNCDPSATKKPTKAYESKLTKICHDNPVFIADAMPVTVTNSRPNDNKQVPSSKIIINSIQTNNCREAGERVGAATAAAAAEEQSSAEIRDMLLCQNMVDSVHAVAAAAGSSDGMMNLMKNSDETFVAKITETNSNNMAVTKATILYITSAQQQQKQQQQHQQQQLEPINENSSLLQQADAKETSVCKEADASISSNLKTLLNSCTTAEKLAAAAAAAIADSSTCESIVDIPDFGHNLSTMLDTNRKVGT